jgi:hypothetical protein
VGIQHVPTQACTANHHHSARCTLPGGYVEWAELGADVFSDDGSMSDDNAFKRSFDLVSKEALPKLGRLRPELPIMTKLLSEAGFLGLQVFSYKLPFGPWPKDKTQKRIGTMALLNMETGIEAYTLFCATRLLGMELEEAKKICDDAWKAVKNKNTHMYHI